MGFFTICVNATVTFVSGAISTTVGHAVYDHLHRRANYLWLDPEHGYFIDHPEDDRKENTLSNIIHRMAVSNKGG